MSDSIYLLQAIGLSKSFGQRAPWKRPSRVKILDDVDIVLPHGKTVAIVGKSGSGKTTLAMCLALVEEPDTGNILFENRGIASLTRSDRRAVRQRIQMVFQHSVEALSPRMTAAEVVEEPLRIQGSMPSDQRSQLARRLLEQVGLTRMFHGRGSHELSGGQRQRVAIARSLTLSPSLLILDEPFVGLDAPIRNQIVNLLVELQEQYKLTYLYISHDLKLVRYFADTVLTMNQGRLTSVDRRETA